MSLLCRHNCGCPPFTDKTQLMAHYKTYRDGSCVEHFKPHREALAREAQLAAQEEQERQRIRAEVERRKQERQRLRRLKLDDEALAGEHNDHHENDDNGEPSNFAADAVDDGQGNQLDVEELMRRKFFRWATLSNRKRGQSLRDLDDLIKLIHDFYLQYDSPNKAKLTFQNKDDYVRYTSRLLDESDDGWESVTLKVTSKHVRALRGQESIEFTFHYKRLDKWLKDDFGRSEYKGDFALNSVQRTVTGDNITSENYKQR